MQSSKKKFQNTNTKEELRKVKPEILEIVRKLKEGKTKTQSYSIKTKELNKTSMEDGLGNRILYLIIWKPLPKLIKRKVIELMSYFRRRNPKDFILD